MRKTPFVSLIVPIRNEAYFIDDCVKSLLGSDYPDDKYELLLVDGMSDDGTREIIYDLIEKNSNIRILDNPQKITAAAMNVGIKNARGEIVLILGAHASYPLSYVRHSVDDLLEWKADNVGGLCIIKPGANTARSHALAEAQKHPIGVGNATYRLGIETPRWVDTVPFGCFKKDIFNRVGLFDTDLVRNQDDELNARITGAGGKILLDPQIQFEYYTRPTFSQTARMFYQYGYFKPLAAVKAGRLYTIRQLVPPSFVLTFIILALGSFFHQYMLFGFLLLTAIYLSITVSASILSIPRSNPLTALWLAPAFWVMHFSYGFGALRGFWDLVVRRKRIKDAQTSR